jgi:hypothetical protein
MKATLAIRSTIVLFAGITLSGTPLAIDRTLIFGAGDVHAQSATGEAASGGAAGGDGPNGTGEAASGGAAGGDGPSDTGEAASGGAAGGDGPSSTGIAASGGIAGGNPPSDRGLSELSRLSQLAANDLQSELQALEPEERHSLETTCEIISADPADHTAEIVAVCSALE